MLLAVALRLAPLRKPLSKACVTSGGSPEKCGAVAAAAARAAGSARAAGDAAAAAPLKKALLPLRKLASLQAVGLQHVPLPKLA